MVPTLDDTLSDESLPSNRRFSAVTVKNKLTRISSKIQKHLDGEKKMHLGRVKKAAATLKSIENEVDPTDKSFVSAAKNILYRIRKQLATKSGNLETQNSPEKSICWRTRSTNKFLKIGSAKRGVQKYKSLLGSLCHSRDSNLPNTFSLELLTDDNFITQQQTKECDNVSMDVEISSSPAANILINNISDEKEQESTTNNNIQPSLVQIDSESQCNNFSSNRSEKVSDNNQTSNFQESQTAPTNIEVDTNPPTFDAQRNSNEPKNMSNETEQISSTNSMQIGSTSLSGDFSSSSPEDIANSIIIISPFQESQPNVESITEANISNNSLMSIQIMSDKKDEISETYTDTQIGSKSQISNFEESNSHQEAFEVETISNEPMESSQLNNLKSINIISNIRLRSANVSPAPSHASYLDSFKSFLENSRTDDFHDTEESQQKKTSISYEKYEELINFENLEKEPVVTQVTNISDSLTTTVTIYEEQQLISSEASEIQTTNSYCFTPSSQTNELEANIAMPQSVKDKGIFSQANMESGISQQSSEIMPGTQQSYCVDAYGTLLENNMMLNPEPQQTNNLDADEPVDRNIDKSVIWLDVSLVDVDDMDLTDVGDSCIIDGDDQSKKETNNYSPVPETQASFIFGLSKPESTNNNVFPAQQLSITQTSEKFDSQSDTETIIPETIYTHSQRLESKSPRIKSPYKNTQSSSFLIYKATGKSKASLAKPKGSESQGKILISASSSSSTPSGDNANLPSRASSLSQIPSRNIFHYPVSESSSSQENPRNTISQSLELQSQNLMLINGCIPENPNSQNHNDEAPYAEKEEKLVEKVMRRRERRTNDEWNELPVSEKVSGTYADKFHVRIFDDPVEALTNIRYRPSFSTFTFPRLTLREVHDGLKKVVNDSRKMDSVLKNIIDKLKDQTPGLNFSKRLGNVESSDDSDSSDEEGKFNRRWLREYRAKTRTQNRCLMAEPEKEKPDFTSRRGPTLEIEATNTEEEKDEAAMVDLMAKFGECAWLKNEHV